MLLSTIIFDHYTCIHLNKMDSTSIMATENEITLKKALAKANIVFSQDQLASVMDLINIAKELVKCRKQQKLVVEYQQDVETHGDSNEKYQQLIESLKKEQSVTDEEQFDMIVSLIRENAQKKDNNQ